MTVEAMEAVPGRQRATLFRGLSEHSRLEILQALAEGPLSVSEIARRTGLTQPNTSNHLACMLGCGLVSRERVGRFSYYRQSSPTIAQLLAVADQVVRATGTGAMECPHCGTAL